MKSSEIPFPKIDAPKPNNWEDESIWTPGNREAYLNEEARGLHQIPCPNCRRTHKGRLMRCPIHKGWYR